MSPYGRRVGRCDTLGSWPQGRRNSPDISIRTRIASTELGGRSDNLSRLRRGFLRHPTIDRAKRNRSPGHKIAAYWDAHTLSIPAPINIINYNFRAFRINFMDRSFN